MGVKVLNVNDYYPKPSDSLFFDNNVWMYLFCPLGNYNQLRQKQYSSFLDKAKSSGSSIFTNSLILSEFSNSYLRMDFEQWKKESGKPLANFKLDYIGTERYQDTAQEISSNVKKILRFCEKSTDNFNAIPIDLILKRMEIIDFNDSYYIELAKLSKLIIVTDDKDFQKIQDVDFTIITV